MSNFFEKWFCKRLRDQVEELFNLWCESDRQLSFLETENIRLRNENWYLRCQLDICTNSEEYTTDPDCWVTDGCEM